MTYEILLRPEAEADIGEAYQWYEAQSDGLGRVFAGDRCLFCLHAAHSQCIYTYPL